MWGMRGAQALLALHCASTIGMVKYYALIIFVMAVNLEGKPLTTKISENLGERLKALGRKGETCGDVIMRLIEFYGGQKPHKSFKGH